MGDVAAVSIQGISKQIGKLKAVRIRSWVAGFIAAPWTSDLAR